MRPSSPRPGPREEAATAGPRAPAGPRSEQSAPRALLRCLDRGWVERGSLARPASVRPGRRQLREARCVASLTRHASSGPRYFSPGGPRLPSPRWAHLRTGHLGAGRFISDKCAGPRNVASGQAAFIAPARASIPGERGCCASPQRTRQGWIEGLGGHLPSCFVPRAHLASVASSGIPGYAGSTEASIPRSYESTCFLQDSISPTSPRYIGNPVIPGYLLPAASPGTGTPLARTGVYAS